MINTENGLKLIGTKSQANIILSREKKFGIYNCIFSIKSAPQPTTIKGIVHGIPLEMKLGEIKQENENTNTVKIEKI